MSTYQKHCSWILALCLFWVPAAAFPASLKILIKPSIAKVEAARRNSISGLISSVPVRVRSGILQNNRRFRIITSTGRSMFGRKLRAIGKRTTFPTNAGSITTITYAGQLRRPGEGNSGNFHLSLVLHKRGRAALAGSFNSPPYSQNIHETRPGLLRMQSFFTANMPRCAGELDAISDADESAAGAGGESPPMSADGDLTIDIAILLSTEMVTAYGSLDAAVAEANNAIAAANTAYTNSEIAQQLRLVYVGQTATAQDASIATDLERLQDVDDGFFDEAHTLRNTYGADIVSLFRYESAPTACGIAYTMQTEDLEDSEASFAAFAFSTVQATCATGNYSFAHELGHVMGATHDVANASAAGAFSYSYGYNFMGTNNSYYRTVMAYDSHQPGEVRVPYFSNPNVMFQGAATGTVNANNALTLNNTASVVAAFRNTVVGATPTPTPTPAIAVLFKNVKVGAVKRKCSINGVLKYADGTVAFPVAIELRRTTGSLLKTVTTNSSGKFNFKTSPKKKYRLVAGESLTRTVTCR